MMFKQFLIATLFLVTVLLTVTIDAECPNGCSGAGTCGPKDKCTCFKNRQGNDCSQFTCPFGYAHVDSPIGDLNMDGTLSTTKVVTGSQVFPEGVVEKFPINVADEGHFYAECSNKGICDRSSGDCECFDGFTGSSCQRTACPSDCNGHGTCESIAELASNAAGTLYGDWVDAGATSYGLWDAKKTYGCKCDPWFHGPDCSSRRCKTGVDPMYSSGTPIYDTQVIRIGHGTTPSGSFRLRFYDNWGESYITKKISFASASANDPVLVKDALKSLPNNVVEDVLCERLGALSVLAHATTFTGGVGIDGLMVACKFTHNPGKLRLMDIVDSLVYTNGALATSGAVSYITGTSTRGEEVDWAGTVSTSTVTTTGDSTTATMSALDATRFGTPDTTVGNYKLAKINDQYVMITDISGTDYVMAYAWNNAVASSAKIFVSQASITADSNTLSSWAVGDNFFVYATGTNLVRGNWIFYHNQFFIVTSVDSTNFKVYVDRPFNGQSVAAGDSVSAATDAILIVTPPTSGTYTYVSECSGRGICDSDTGICSCFKGYTRDNCNTQNILAF